MQIHGAKMSAFLRTEEQPYMDQVLDELYANSKRILWSIFKSKLHSVFHLEYTPFWTLKLKKTKLMP